MIESDNDLALHPARMHGLALCAGIGGLELGLEIAVSEYRTVVAIEGEAYCAAILVSKMEVGELAPFPVWSDVRTFDGLPWRGKVDIITGGIPCQPFSVAGQRRGGEVMISREDKLKALVFLMKEVLEKNDHKGGWGRCDFRYLLKRLREEIAELEDVYFNPLPVAYDQKKYNRQTITKECIDVANFAMMIADNFGDLKTWAKLPLNRKLEKVAAEVTDGN